MDSCSPPSQGSSFLTLLGLLVLGLFCGLPARAAPKLQTFHIEAGEASHTLNEFSRQSGLQLLFDYNIVRGRKTRAVSGEWAAPAALKQMLADTGLVFDFVNDRTLAVTLANHDATAGSAIAEAPSSGSKHARPAATQSVEHEQDGSSDLSVDSRVAGLDEVTITGTHVRGGQPIGDQLISIGRDNINASGVATVTEFLRTLPQAFGGGPSEDTHYFGAETSTNSGQGAGINLRGLGAGATLVLINGKRLAPSGSEGAFADVENIPLSAVERIDILPDSASALYGADAVGGVVNFIMRDHFTGAESFVRSGSGTQGTLREYQVAQTVGTRWDAGNAMVSLEFYRRGDLPAAARKYATSNLVPFGGGNFDITESNPGNIFIGNESYAIPRGQNGTALTASDLVAGTRNLSDWHANSDLLPSQKRWSLYSSVKHELSDNLTVFGSALLSERDAKSYSGGFTYRFPVPSTNAFYVNPMGGNAPETVAYNFLDDIGPVSTDSLVNNVNVTLGLDVAVGTAWKVSLFGNYAQDKENQFTGGQLNFSSLQTALADPNPATAFNPYADGSNTNPATLKSLVTGSRFYTNSKLRSLDVIADGPIAQLPGGPIKLALGADHRNQVFATVAPPSLPFTVETRTDNSRNVMAAFGEITVPVFGERNGGRGYRHLEFSVAGRYEHYSDFGQAATPKIGLFWAPAQSVSFRGTWGRSVSAPTLADLDTSHNVVIPVTLADNSSAQGMSNVLVESGKNANLTIERARSWTAGLEIDARQWVEGLTFSTTYFNIDFKNRIEQPLYSPGVLNDPAFASLLIRNPTTAQLSYACSQGTYLLGAALSCIQYLPAAILDFRIHNLERVSTQGLDFNASYDRPWAAGTLKLTLDGTYLLRFSQAEGPDSPVRQLLDTQNNPINLKMRGALSWQQRRWGLTVGVNFQNHYMDVVSEPHRTISAYTTFDTQLRYELAPFSTGALQNTRLELNAINVFNESPPFLNNQVAALAYDQENADPDGRRLSIQLRKTW
jgi:iron complex outermembrane receptor protein